MTGRIGPSPTRWAFEFLQSCRSELDGHTLEQLFPSLEPRPRFSGDDYRFPGFWVASGFWRDSRQGKRTEPADFNAAPVTHGASHCVQDLLHNKLRVAVINPIVAGKAFDQVGLVIAKAWASRRQ